MVTVRPVILFFALILIATALSACGNIKPDAKQSYPMDPDDARRAKRGKLTGEGGIKFFGGEKKETPGSALGVNSFLWRATLDTLSFMPLASTDPHGGVIITDWYEDPAARGERFKVNVLILGTELRVDGLRVTVFKQTKSASGTWQDSAVGTTTARDLEDKILTRARELRIHNAE